MPPLPPLNDQGLPSNYPFKPDWEVTPRQVKALLNDNKDFVFIDCRQPLEYEHVHIQGTQLLPLQSLAAHIDDLNEHQNAQVIVHCHHGGRSLQMTAMLREAGFSNVKSMAGGIDLWSLDIDPSLIRY